MRIACLLLLCSLLALVALPVTPAGARPRKPPARAARKAPAGKKSAKAKKLAKAAAAKRAAAAKQAAAKKAAAARKASLAKKEREALARRAAAGVKPGKVTAGKPGPMKPGTAVVRPPAPSLAARGGTKPVAPRPVRQTPPARPALPPLPLPPATVFRTDRPYDAQIDLRTDFVAVERQGGPWEEAEAAIRSWKGAGYMVHRALNAGADAGSRYVSGKADGSVHPGDVDLDAAGRPIGGPAGPAVLPAAGWIEYLKDQVRRSIDAGAEGIWIEPPHLSAAGGYAPLFKNEWRDLYMDPWQAPHSGPAAFFRTARLRSDFGLRMVDELLRFTHEYAKQAGREVKVLLAAASPMGGAAAGRVFPLAGASRLPVDGVVATVGAGDDGLWGRSTVTYEGRSEARPFESAWMQFSYAANLMEVVADKPVYFHAEPSGSGDAAESAYRSTLAASLLHPQARGFQVATRPERLLAGRGSQTGDAPAPFWGPLTNVTGALRELPGLNEQAWGGGTTGIGLLVLDTLSWQSGGPKGSTLRSLDGLAMPLLRRGIPVELVPGERITDRAYLARYKLLILSYDMQKPLGPEVNLGIAEWVKDGGTLLLVGGEDAYNEIGEWWTRNGYACPHDHLLRECGAQVEIARRSVRSGNDRFRSVLELEAVADPRDAPRPYTLPLGRLLTAGKPLYVRFSDATPETAGGARLARVRLVEGGRVRADFTAGGPGERPFLVEDTGSKVEAGTRSADGGASFVYRFSRLGTDARLELELAGRFRVGAASGADPAAQLQPAVQGLPAARVPETYPVVTYPLAGAGELFRLAGEAGAPAWSSPATMGHVVYCGLPAAYFADSGPGADLLRALVRFACGKAGLDYQEGYMIARRGSYVVAHAQDHAARLKGLFVDLFSPGLDLLEDPNLPYREPVFYKEVTLSSRVPTVLHATHRAVPVETNNVWTRVRMEGPTGTAATLRIWPAGMLLLNADAAEPNGERVPVEVTYEGRTLRVRLRQSAPGTTVVLRWVRPEARLTK